MEGPAFRQSPFAAPDNLPGVLPLLRLEGVKFDGAGDYKQVIADVARDLADNPGKRSSLKDIRETLALMELSMSEALPDPAEAKAKSALLGALTLAGGGAYGKATIERPSAKIGESSAANQPIQLTKYDLGELAFQGGEKDIYELPGTPNKLVSVFQKEGIFSDLGERRKAVQSEIAALDELAEIGLPTVRHFGEAQIDGEPAIVMENIPGAQPLRNIIESKAARGMVKPLFNQNTKDDLRLIEEKLSQLGLQVKDLQFLIKKDGHVVINDPSGIVHRGNTEDQNMTIDKILTIGQDFMK